MKHGSCVGRKRIRTVVSTPLCNIILVFIIYFSKNKKKQSFNLKMSFS